MSMRSIATRLPPPVRRRLGRVKRALFPPPPKAARAPRPASRPAAGPPPAPKAPAPPAPAERPTPAARLALRRSCAFASTDPGGRILEIGAAHNGILPKRDGYDTRIVDYLDRQGLVDKYADFSQYSPDDIEEVDYVLPPGATMPEVISERFDLVLASHVLEHTTSLVQFVNDCAGLLKQGGVLALVVPDKRYTFDRFRERSSLSRVIDTYHRPPSVHTPGTLAEFFLNATKHRGTTSWVAGHRGDYSLVHPWEQGQVKYAEAVASTTYVDVHNWIFTPNHLRLLLDDLHTLGLVTLRESYFHDTVGHEFFLNLQLGGPGSGLSREELIVLADAEQTGMDRPVFEAPVVEQAARTAADGPSA